METILHFQGKSSEKAPYLSKVINPLASRILVSTEAARSELLTEINRLRRPDSQISQDLFLTAADIYNDLRIGLRLAYLNTWDIYVYDPDQLAVYMTKADIQQWLQLYADPHCTVYYLE